MTILILILAEQELLGNADEGRVYVLFPRGLEAAGPGSPDAHIEPDELPIRPNEELRIVDRSPAGEPDWMMAEKVEGEASGQRGLVPRAFISRFRIVRVPPASQPIPLLSPNSVDRRLRAFQSPSPIEEEEEGDGITSDTETELTADGGSPQMVEKDEYSDEIEKTAVELNNHEIADENEVSVSRYLFNLSICFSLSEIKIWLIFEFSRIFSKTVKRTISTQKRKNR